MYPELSKAKLSAVPQIFSILFARVLSLGFIQIHKKKQKINLFGIFSVQPIKI